LAVEQPNKMSDDQFFERLAIYSMSIEYPNTFKVEFNPKSQRNEGDVAFRSPEGYRVFLSWGPIEKVQGIGDTREHANYSIERIKKSGEEVKEVTYERVQVNGHEATFSYIKLDRIKRTIFFGKEKTPNEARSFHIHCDQSARYFVLYGAANPRKSDQQREVIDMMVRSFTCH
jgi:hypothetical protein